MYYIEYEKDKAQKLWCRSDYNPVGGFDSLEKALKELNRFLTEDINLNYRIVHIQKQVVPIKRAFVLYDE